jgi:hypothetical protein
MTRFVLAGIIVVTLVIGLIVLDVVFGPEAFVATLLFIIIAINIIDLGRKRGI